MDQAVQIVVSEIESLERRVRAFSEFASEPSVHPEFLDINAIVSERVALLRPVHPAVTYDLRLDAGRPRAYASADMVNGILTNLLQNGAEAAGTQGTIRVVTRREGDRIVIDGFRLDVPAGDGGLRNTATTLTVEGDVVVYTPSIAGILDDGTKRLIDTLTTPTADELAGLTRLTLPLRGVLADSIAYDDSHQATF